MTADAQTNGHAPEFPPPGMPMPSEPQAPPTPSNVAALKAVQQRLSIARQTVQAREDEIDYFNAMFMTVAQERDALAAENSQLKSRIAELENPTTPEEPTPEGGAGN